MRTIQYWTDIGLVEPDIQPSRGKGKARVYSERNLIEFGMIDLMVTELNYALKEVEAILSLLRIGYMLEGLDESQKEEVLKEVLKKMKLEKLDKDFVKETLDFYTNPEWGIAKDLSYTNVRYMSDDAEGKKGTLRQTIYLHFTDPNEDELVVSGQRIVSTRSLMVGKVKNQAMRKLGLKT